MFSSFPACASAAAAHVDAPEDVPAERHPPVNTGADLVDALTMLDTHVFRLPEVRRLVGEYAEFDRADVAELRTRLPSTLRSVRNLYSDYRAVFGKKATAEMFHAVTNAYVQMRNAFGALRGSAYSAPYNFATQCNDLMAAGHVLRTTCQHVLDAADEIARKPRFSFRSNTAQRDSLAQSLRQLQALGDAPFGAVSMPGEQELRGGAAVIETQLAAFQRVSPRITEAQAHAIAGSRPHCFAGGVLDVASLMTYLGANGGPMTPAQVAFVLSPTIILAIEAHFEANVTAIAAPYLPQPELDRIFAAMVHYGSGVPDLHITIVAPVHDCTKYLGSRPMHAAAANSIVVSCAPDAQATLLYRAGRGITVCHAHGLIVPGVQLVPVDDDGVHGEAHPLGLPLDVQYS